MSLFFEYPVEAKSAKQHYVFQSQWSSGESPVLAVAYSNGTVRFSNEEGEQIVEPYDRKVPCSCLAWHPQLPLLAIGYEDGALVVWTPRAGVLRVHQSTHKKRVTIAVWSPVGSRLVSADLGGTIAVWAPKPDGSLMLMCKHSKRVALSHCVFSVGVGGRERCPPFFLGSESGELFIADDQGHCSHVLTVDGGVAFMHHEIAGNYLVIVTKNVVLLKYTITLSPQMRMAETKKVKLSVRGSGSDMKCSMAGPGLLAAANSESMIRLWDLEAGENYTLHPEEEPSEKKNASPDSIRTIAYNPTKRLLTAGTARGRVHLWRYVGSPDAKNDDSSWHPMATKKMSSGIFDLTWAPGSHGLLAVGTHHAVAILNQHRLLCKSVLGKSYVQLTKSHLIVRSEEKVFQLEAGVRITHVAIDNKSLIISDGLTAEVYSIGRAGLNKETTFKSKTRVVALKGDNIFIGSGRAVQMLSHKGVVKNELSFTEGEGGPRKMDVWGKFLVTATTNGFLRLWDISLRTPKLIVPKRRFEPLESIITMIKVNCAGTKVAILRNALDPRGVQHHDHNLYVYDVELDRFHAYDFGVGKHPLMCFWDPNEPDLLAVQINSIDHSVRTKMNWKKRAQKDNAKLEDGEIATMFATSDYGILMQDSFKISTTMCSLMGIEVPHISLMTREDKEAGQGSISVRKHTMRDFIGLENVSSEEKKNLMSFSYYLTVGNMDEAYRAVKKIESKAIWENMAHTCIKTKRLDVARVCLGNMHNACGAREVRHVRETLGKEAELVGLFRSTKNKALIQSQEQMQVNAEVAMMAIQLDMLDDAERLYLESKRYDLLVALYQSCGRWEEALSLCEKHDRIHLKSTHYKYARFLEGCGEIKKAMEQYEKAGVHCKEIPRMLYDIGHIQELGKYIKSRGEKELYRWWAQYCASEQDYNEALHFYNKAEDWLSVVKVLIHNQEMQRAHDLVKTTQDPSAAFHLARRKEESDMIKEAIELYKLAGRHNHGIRLAMQHGLEENMIDLALKSEGDSALQLQVAEYFERRHMNERAVVLYHKGGNINKAISLCFEGQLFQELRSIAEEFDEKTDPALLNRCGEFFMAHKQYDKAVALFITANKVAHALALCQKHGVRISDKMAEKLTPPKIKDPEKLEERKKVLTVLAECLRDQGSYHVACKKFTQAGDKISAMRCLLKSKDTDKIIYYATMTRKKEIYILSANYMQNLNWHAKPDIMKKIILFYSKAKAYEKLSNFYNSCAQVEIDEYRDYVKALGALKEANKYISKSKKALDKESKVASLQRRIKHVESFVKAREIMGFNPAEMVAICERLIAAPDVEQAVRVGDVFALLTEHHYAKDNMQEAMKIIKQMKARNIAIQPYLDAKIIRTICDATGNSMEDEKGGGRGIEDEIGEEIEEAADYYG